MHDCEREHAGSDGAWRAQNCGQSCRRLEQFCQGGRLRTRIGAIGRPAILPAPASPVFHLTYICR
jgi:hypothetical protein